MDENEAPRSSLLRRNSRLGCEGRKLRDIRRKRIKSCESIVDSPFCVEEQHPSRRCLFLRCHVMNLTASRKHDILTSLFGILDEAREEHIT